MDNVKYSIYDNIMITPRPNDKYKVLGDFKYKDIIVPKGYHTNGADIPRFLWIFWPPNRSSYLPAVVVHDYLCDKEDYSKADEYFKEILSILNVNKFTVWCFYNSVKFYHIFKSEKK